jgi:Protein of unknown function (DUF1822)
MDLVMNKIENDLLSFTVVLTNDAHEISRQSVRGISSRVKAKQVYANTLAVYAVNYYFQCLGFEPDWLHSASRDPLSIQLMNVADLEIKGIGKIECIPVLTDAPTENLDRIEECQIPPESEHDRVGYLPVQINEDLTEATILGFSTQKSGIIQLDRLKDLEYAIEYLTNLEQPAIVRLREWLNGLVDSAWEPLDRILNPNQLRLHYRGAVNRGQKIDLYTSNGMTSSTLAIDVKHTNADRELDVLVQVYPTRQNELPAGVKLTIIDDTETMMTAISKVGDNWIQLNFTAMFDEEFTIKVGLENSEVIKKFVV